MCEVVKLTKVHGSNGVFQCRALIDTGTREVVMPRHIALRAGTRLLYRKNKKTGEREPDTGEIGLAGNIIEIERREVDVEVINSGCRAKMVALVPVDGEDIEPEFMLGSLFLQKTGAAIVYREKHPVFHVPGKFHVFSKGGGVGFTPRTEGQHTSLRASTSPTRKKVAKKRRSPSRKPK